MTALTQEERVQRAGKAHERQTHFQRVDEFLLGVAYVRVALHVTFDLRFASAEGADDGEGQQFAGFHIEAAARVDVAEAEGGKMIHHDGLLAFGGGGVHGVDDVAENAFLHVESLLEAGFIRDRSLIFQRQGDAARGKRRIDFPQRVFRGGKSDVGRALIHGFADLHRGNAVRKRGFRFFSDVADGPQRREGGERHKMLLDRRKRAPDGKRRRVRDGQHAI